MNPIVNAAGKVIFQPWPGPQTTFWDFTGRYGLYAGSGFTGKTDLLRWYPWQQIQAEEARIKAAELAGETWEPSTGHALILRRETPELRELMNRCRLDFERANPDLEWKAGDKTWFHPCGYRITVGHCENEEDWNKYQGWSISCLCMDEGTTFTEKQFTMIDSWVRQPKESKLTPIVRMGSNPVGVGLLWVRKFFVEAGYDREEAPRYWGKPITREVEVTIRDDDGKSHKEKRTSTRIYVPARVSDNKSVDQGDYLATFADKPDAIVRAIRDGDWYVVTDSLLGMLWESLIHTVKPYKVAANRHRFRSIHFTYASTVVHWWAVDTNGNFTCYRELALKSHTADMVANRIRELEEEAGDEWIEGRCSKLSGPLGPASCWPKKGQIGPSVSETMHGIGINVSPADESPPIDQIRYRLIKRNKHPTEKDANGRPAMTIAGVRFFKTCQHSIDTIPALSADKKDPDAPDAAGDSVAYKSMAYAVMSRPLVPEREMSHPDDFEKWERPKTTSRASRTGLPGGW